MSELRYLVSATNHRHEPGQYLSTPFENQGQFREPSHLARLTLRIDWL